MICADLQFSLGFGGEFCGVYRRAVLVGVVDSVASRHRGDLARVFINRLLVAAPLHAQGVGLVWSFWDSLEAICGFAGPEVEKAVYYPQDREGSSILEPTAEHGEGWQRE